MSKAKQTTTTANQTADYQTVMLNAIQNRITAAPNDNQREKLTAEFKFFADKNGAVILDKVSDRIDLNALARQISISEKSDSNFLAVYALQKVRKMLYALANNTRSFIDGYSNSIIYNMVKLNAEITNKSAQVSLSKSVEYDEFDKVQSIDRKVNCAASTASTQTSSTRQMMRALNIATVTKRKNGDEFTFTDSAAAKQVIAFYQQ